MPHEYEDEAEIYDAKTNGFTLRDVFWIVVGAALIIFGMKLIFQ